MVVLVGFMFFWPSNLVFSSDSSETVEDVYDDTTVVIVRYQDEFGVDLLPATVGSRARVGELYAVSHENELLAEFDFISSIGSPVGFHLADDIELIFIYRRRPIVNIVADRTTASIGELVKYTLTITNNGNGRISDSYLVRVTFEQGASVVNNWDFTLNYLDQGETIVELSAPIDQQSATGTKKITTTLIHPARLNIIDTTSTTQIEITSMLVNFSPLTSTPNILAKEDDFEKNSCLDNDCGEEKNDDLDSKIIEPTSQLEIIAENEKNVQTDSDEGQKEVLLEDVENEVDFSMMMIGTFSYDIVIVGAIVGKLARFS